MKHKIVDYSLVSLQQSIDADHQGPRTIPLQEAMEIFEKLLNVFTFSCLGVQHQRFAVKTNQQGFVKSVDYVDHGLNRSAYLKEIFWNLKNLNNHGSLAVCETVTMEYKFHN